MSIFDIDEQGRKALDEQVALNPLDLSKVTTGTFSGFGTALGSGIMQGGSRTATTVALAGSPVAGARDSYLNSFRTPETQQLAKSLGIKPDTSAPTSAGQDWYFQNVVEDVGQAATDYWAPDPAQIGSAGRIANGLAQIVLPLAAAGGNPALLAGNEGLETPAALVKQGVDARTATGFGIVSAGATLLGFKVPASFGSTLLQRLGTGTAANLAVGVATSAAQSGALKAGGYDKQAEAYSPMNAEARTVDALTGLVFGGIAHMQAPKVTASQRDAVLTAANAKHVQVDTAPGLPVDEASNGAHQAALASAIGSILRGEPVSIAESINAAEFLPVQRQGMSTEPLAAYTLPPTEYGAYRRALESGGDPNATNGRSTATGIDQFTAGTWRRIVAQTRPAWAEGMNDNQILAARRDPAKSGQMAEALDDQNTAALEAAGLDPTAHNLYASHHFGSEGGVKFARAADDTPMSRILSRGQLEANPYLKGKTKGEAIANWDARAKRAGIGIPEPVRADVPAEAAAVAQAPVQIPAAMTGTDAAQVIEQRLSTLDELATTGRLQPEEVATLRAEDQSLVELIRRQEQITRDNILPADPRERLAPADLEQLSERRVEIRQALEQSNAATGYATVARQLRTRLEKIDQDADLIGLAERITGRMPRVEAPARPVLPDARPTPDVGIAAVPRGGPGASPRAAAAVVEAQPRATPDSVLEQGGAVPASLGGAEARPTQSVAAAGDMPDVTQQAALEAVAASPDMQITMDDGTVMTAAEALATVDADIAQAQSDSRGFAAAVACSLRFA